MHFLFRRLFVLLGVLWPVTCDPGSHGPHGFHTCPATCCLLPLSNARVLRPLHAAWAKWVLGEVEERDRPQMLAGCESDSNDKTGDVPGRCR